VEKTKMTEEICASCGFPEYLHPINQEDIKFKCLKFTPQKEDNHTPLDKRGNSLERKDGNLFGEQGSFIPTDKKGSIPFSAPLNFKTLSYKIFVLPESDGSEQELFLLPVKDVKEAVKELKKKVKVEFMWDFSGKDITELIDKIFGEKLIEWI
jgi:hypothetical protein